MLVLAWEREKGHFLRDTYSLSGYARTNDTGSKSGTWFVHATRSPIELTFVSLCLGGYLNGYNNINSCVAQPNQLL